MENYFTNSLLYLDSLGTDENPHPEEHDSGNEADTEPKEEECLWEINSLVTSIDKNVKSEWFINKNLDLAYFSAFASDSVPSDTSTDIDSNPWSKMDSLISLHARIKSSLMVREKIGDTRKAFL